MVAVLCLGFLFVFPYLCEAELRLGTEIDYPLVDTLRDHSLLTAPDRAWIDDVVLPIVSKTKYHHRWAINQPVRVGYINFYFLKPNFAAETNLPSEVRDYRDQLVGNCAYLGTQGIVVCDSDFLRAFGYDHGVPWRGIDPKKQELGFEGQVNQRLELVALWIIGHEVGHVLNGDGESDAARERPLVSISPGGQTLQQLQDTKDREYAADRKFAELISRDKVLVNSLVSMLMDLINAELVLRYGKPETFGPGFELDYSKKTIAYYFDNDPKQTHPEYLVRAVRILQQIAISTNDVGLEGLLGSFSYKFKQADK